MEEMISMHFIIRIVGPVRCGKVIFTVSIGESRPQVVGTGRRAIFRIECRPHAVPNTKNVGIVHKGIGYFRGSHYSQSAVFHTVERFGEAGVTPVEFTRQTIN